jgi:succinoglycan biosynthesis transport protein ExoP
MMNYAEKKREVDFIEYWSVIVKRKWVIITFAGTLIFFTGVFSFFATPKYKSKATLLIEEETSGILSIDETFGYQPRVFKDLRFFNTQLKLLESESLAERVARKMNLLSRSEFGAGKNPKKGLIASAKDLISFKWITPKNKSKGKKSRYMVPSDPYSEIVKEVQNSIKVNPIRDTKLVEVSFTSPSPILATEVVNALSEEFIDFSIEKRYKTTQQASDFLDEQIANLRDDLATKERELQKYSQEKELFFLSDTESSVVSKFADLNKAFTQAQIDRINKEASYRELKALDVDSLPQIVGNLLIQNLAEEYSKMINDYKEKSRLFKPDYPEMNRLKTRLDSMKEELQNEIKKAVNAAGTEYRSALKEESSLKNLLEKQKADVVRMNSNSILYNSLKIEVENNRTLLNSLVERQSETLVSARLGGLNTSSISIIDKAKVPKNPVSPKKKLNLILALLMGVFGGVGLCFFFEYLDNTVKGSEDVEKLVGLPSLGVIPFLPPEGVKKKMRHGYYSRHGYSYGKENPGSENPLPEIKEIELVNHLHPRFSISEDYRTVRTSILLSHAESPPKTILFTSALPKEGKTATVVNMAVAFSQLEERVLIIDADLRKPRLHRIFKVRNLRGLSGYLTGNASLEDAIQETSVENIWVLPSGLTPPNPTELLNSKKMMEMMEGVKNIFDVILVDSTPVLPVIDAVVVSSLVDSTVFVIKAGELKHKPFLNAVDELRQVKVKIIGVLFNELKMTRGDYSFMNYYRYYRQHYYGEEEKQTSSKQKEG